jgi:hypothetical protein
MKRPRASVTSSDATAKPTLARRLRDAALISLLGPALLAIGFLLLRHSLGAQGGNVTDEAATQKVAAEAVATTQLCEFRGCTKPAVWMRTVGGGLPHFWCEEHLRTIGPSGTPGIFGLVLILPGIAATFAAISNWVDLVRGRGRHAP